MSSSAEKVERPRAVRVSVTQDKLAVALDDGRTIAVPLPWYPRLAHATSEERDAWRLIGGALTPRRVRVTATALRHVRREKAWWREHSQRGWLFAQCGARDGKVVRI